MRLIVYCFLLLSACSSHGVRCNSHLQPINPPASGSLPNTPSARNAE
jgi:hypothetical protein